MTKNLGRKYAAMTEDERRQFALTEEEGSRELPAELEFEEPRLHEGAQYASPREEIADPEHRDGLSAQLDDEGHERAVKDWTHRSKRVDPDLDLSDENRADETTPRSK
jgi:hypothetical protein